MLKVSKKGECIRTVANYSKQTMTDKFDKPKFDLEEFTRKMFITSPKLKELIKTINALDQADMATHNKLFKHIIYTDLKKSSAGAKMIATGLMSNGFSNVYDKSLKIREDDLYDNPYNNFALLSSVAVYGKPFPISLKKKILSIFNTRPDNIQGEAIRFIILDQGFKEGIDVFDVKYLHLFEPLITSGDEKQAIGRGTRYCGQKGLEFDPKTAWPLHVFKYDLEFDDELKEKYKASTVSQLFMNNSGIDLNKLTFASELETISKYGAVDFELTETIHNYSGEETANIYIPDKKALSNIIGPTYDIISSSLDNLKNLRKGRNIYTRYRSLVYAPNVLSSKVKSPLGPLYNTIGGSEEGTSDTGGTGGGIKGKRKKGRMAFMANAPRKQKEFLKMRQYIKERFMKYKWGDIVFENKCKQNAADEESRIVKYTPTQEFVSKYFTNSSAYKGLLLWHSVGTGKTCSAISIASQGFEPHGYTILWVTRHTLKTDIWKNMYGSVCSAILRRRINNGEDIPQEMKRNPLKYLSNSWIMPISYKQFTNMLMEKNDVFKKMKKRNGAIDPLRKTLVIIDEVHKLYSADLPIAERPNMKILKNKIQNSYKESGKDSVRLLLMSATPYTSNPMDLIKIVNLMKEENDMMPEEFEEFSKEYLDFASKFTDVGSEKYLDHIAPYISYLNREKDVRQFAYPVFYQVNANISRRDTGEEKGIRQKLSDIEKRILDASRMPKDKERVIEIKELKKMEKDFKKQLVKLGKKNANDNSQETYLENCMKK